MSGESFKYEEDKYQIEDLHKYIDFYIDSSSKQVFSKIRVQKFSPLMNQNFGHTKHAIWYKLIVFNDSAEELVLQVGPEWTSNIEVFKIDAYNNFNFKKIGGVLFPYQQKDIKSNKHLFNLKMEEQEQAIVYVKITGNHIISPHFIISNRAGLLGGNRIEDHIYFMYIGVIFLLVLFNVFVGIITRQRSFLYYSLYVSCMAMNVLFNKGYPNEWADLFWLSNHHSIFFALAIVFVLLSIAAFTQVKKQYRVLHYCKIFIVFCAFVSIGLNSLDFVQFANEVAIVTIVLSAIWGLGVGVRNLKKKNISAQLILVGYIAFSIGGGYPCTTAEWLPTLPMVYCQCLFYWFWDRNGYAFYLFWDKYQCNKERQIQSTVRDINFSEEEPRVGYR